MIEGHFDTARGSHKGAQLDETALHGAVLLAAEFAVLQLLQRVVDLLRLELPVTENNDPCAGNLGDVEISLVFGVPLGVPKNVGQAVEGPELASENGESLRDDVLQKFLFEDV